MTAIREIAAPLAPAQAELNLDDEFFASETALELEPLELDEERENPVLTPAQHVRRLQLRRQVAALVAGSALFALLALWLRFAG